MGRRNLLVISVHLILGWSVAWAVNGVPYLMPFQGRAVDSSGAPITTSTTFKFRIYPPTGSCYVYEETQTITPNAYGLFSTVLGQTANSTGPANSFYSVFNNDVSLPLTDSCATTYLPIAHDWRRLELVVNGVAVSDLQTIGAAPFAINANFLEGKAASNFINVNGAVTQTNIATLVGNGDASSLHNHDSLYARKDGTNSFTGNITTSANIYATGATASVGIGTSSPTADLQIQKNAPSILLKANSGSGGTLKIDFFGGTTQRGSIQASESGSGLKFYSGTTEALRFDSSANAIFSGSMTVAGTVGLGKYTAAQETTLITALNALGAVATGTIWANTTSGKIRFWDGSAAQDMSSGGAATLPALGPARFWVGDATSAATAVLASGDVTMDNAGAFTIASNAVTTAKINDAAVSTAKLFTNPGASYLVMTDATTGATLAPLSCTAGQLLTWSVGTGWGCTAQSSLSVGTTTNFSGSLSGDVTGTQGATVVSSVGGSTAAAVNTATVAANNAVDTNTASRIVKRDASGNFAAGAVTVGSSVYKDTGSNTVSVQAPNSVTSSYTLKWPTAVGGAGQILSTDASGNLSWLTPNAGTVTSVTASSPLASSGGTTPNITIQVANGTQNGYLSSADWTTFNNKLSTSLTDGKIWVGNGSNVATAITMSGDATISNTGSMTIANNAVTTAKINDGAITTTKLFANPGVRRMVVTDSSDGSLLESLGCAAGQVTTWHATNGWSCTAQSSLSVGTATNFSGSLSGDVTGTQGATVVSSVGGSTAAAVNTATGLANAATSANTASTIVKRDASGNFIAGAVTVGSSVYKDTGSNTVSVQAPNSVTSSYTLKWPAAVGSAGQVLSTDASGNLSWLTPNAGTVTSVSASSPLSSSGGATPNLTIQVANGTQDGYLSSADWTTFNNKQSTTLTDGNIFVGNGSNVATSVTPSGDLTMTNAGAFTVAKIRSKTVSTTAPTSDGQVYRYDSGTSTWVPAFLSLADIRSTVTVTSTMFPSSSCTAGQTLTWSSLTDTMSCTSIAIGDSAITYASKSANTFLAAPNGSSGSPSFRTIASADLPSISLTSGVTGTLPVGNGGTGATNLTANRILVGNGTSAVQVLASAGSTGQILQSNGASLPSWSTPTYPSASGSAGQLLRSDGTNNVYTTATFPDTAAQYDLLYASGANTWASLAKVNTGALVTSSSGVPSWTSGSTANRVLRTDGSAISFGQVALTTDVTGTLPIANGGTGATTQTAAFNALSPATTKGDVIVHNGTNNVRQAVGTNDQALVADSSQSSGVKWGYPGGQTMLAKQLTTVTVTNTTTETSIYSVSIPGNTLGANGGFRVRVQGTYNNNTGNNRTFTLKVKFGSTTMYADTTPNMASSANNRAFYWDLLLMNAGATNSQKLGGQVMVGAVSNATTGTGDLTTTNPLNSNMYGTSAEDTTSAKTFDITITHSTNSTSLTFKAEMVIVELIQ